MLRSFSVKDQRQKEKEKRNPVELDSEKGASTNLVKRPRVNNEDELESEDGDEVYVKSEAEDENESADISSTIKEEKTENSDEADDKNKEKSLKMLSSFSSSSKNPGVKMTMAAEIEKARNFLDMESLIPVPATKKPCLSLTYPFSSQRGVAIENKSGSSTQHPKSKSSSRQVVVAHVRPERTSAALSTSAVAEMRKNLSNLEEFGQRQEEQVSTLAENFYKIRDEHGNEISLLKNMGMGHQNALTAQRVAIERIDNQQMAFEQRLEFLERAQNSNPRGNPGPEVVRVGQVAMGVQSKLGYLCDYCKQTYATKYYLKKKHEPKCEKNPSRSQSSGFRS